MPILTAPNRIRQKRSLLRLITIAAPGFSVPVTARARVQTPSTRLRCTVDAFFEFQGTPLIGPDSIVNYNAQWTIRARTRGTGTFAEPYLHPVVSPALDPARLVDLPNSYQTLAGIDTLQVDVTLTGVPQTGSGSIGAGNWYVRATWEPDTIGVLDDCELERMFDLCDLSGTLVTLF